MREGWEREVKRQDDIESIYSVIQFMLVLQRSPLLVDQKRIKKRLMNKKKQIEME